MPTNRIAESNKLFDRLIKELKSLKKPTRQKQEATINKYRGPLKQLGFGLAIRRSHLDMIDLEAKRTIEAENRAIAEQMYKAMKQSKDGIAEFHPTKGIRAVNPKKNK